MHIQQRHSIATALFLSLIPSLGEADSCTQDYADGFCYTRPDGVSVFVEPAFEDYLFMLFDICDAISLKECNYPVLMGDLGYNALATTSDMTEFMIYDRRLSLLTEPEIVIAHELAHLVCGHLRAEAKNLTPQEIELQADRFAGATWRLLGRSKANFADAAKILSTQPAGDHPSRATRVAALNTGFDEPALHLCR